jgi:hypothetical protein
MHLRQTAIHPLVDFIWLSGARFWQVWHSCFEVYGEAYSNGDVARQPSRSAATCPLPAISEITRVLSRSERSVCVESTAYPGRTRCSGPGLIGAWGESGRPALRNEQGCVRCAVSTGYRESSLRLVQSPICVHSVNDERLLNLRRRLHSGDLSDLDEDTWRCQHGG